MKKKSYLIIFFLIFVSIIFLNNKSYRYIGVNYIVEKTEITNFQKLSDFYQRHTNYKKLVKEITQDSKDKKEEIIDISTWVYENIKKISEGDTVIDNHPWTIVERKLGVSDQFSDILSVLLVHNDIDSFFTTKFKKIIHPITFFKYDNEWCIIDPYYGVYLTNNKNSFSTIKESRRGNLDIHHLTLGKVTIKNLDIIFFDKNFQNIEELNNYFTNLLSMIPRSEIIENTNIYERGGRSYIQKPIHRILVQLKKFLNM
tara:strand:+ start:174 stop:944 length:771 start_codon:yes stop_codon:yes gene_type:complete